MTVMPLLVNMACSPAPEKNEKSKHVITQDSWRLVKIEPEVQDIADHFGLDERITGKLQEALNTRPDPGTDLEVMWEILDEARNPPGLTMIKVKEMLDGTFRMGEQKDAGVEVLKDKFKLDERAAYKLSEVLSTKPNKRDVLKALDIHLAASNNPSALVMLKRWQTSEEMCLWARCHMVPRATEIGPTWATTTAMAAALAVGSVARIAAARIVAESRRRREKFQQHVVIVRRVTGQIAIAAIKAIGAGATTATAATAATAVTAGVVAIAVTEEIDRIDRTGGGVGVDEGEVAAAGLRKRQPDGCHGP